LSHVRLQSPKTPLEYFGNRQPGRGPYFAQNLFRFFVEPDSARCHNHLRFVLRNVIQAFTIVKNHCGQALPQACGMLAQLRRRGSRSVRNVMEYRSPASAGFCAATPSALHFPVGRSTPARVPLQLRVPAVSANSAEIASGRGFPKRFQQPTPKRPFPKSSVDPQMRAGHGQESTSRGWSKVLEGEFPSGNPVACQHPLT
jgi:hypothetical protein